MENDRFSGDGSARRKIEFDPIHWPSRTVTTRRDIVNRLTVDAN